jgi:hypothetical protein
VLASVQCSSDITVRALAFAVRPEASRSGCYFWRCNSSTSSGRSSDSRGREGPDHAWIHRVGFRSISTTCLYASLAASVAWAVLLGWS